MSDVAKCECEFAAGTRRVMHLHRTYYTLNEYNLMYYSHGCVYTLLLRNTNIMSVIIIIIMIIVIAMNISIPSQNSQDFGCL